MDDVSRQDRPGPAGEPSAIGDRVREERFQLLIGQTPLHLVVSATLSVAVSIVVWDVQPRWKVLAFLGAIALTILLRLLALVGFRAKRSLLPTLSAWETLHARSILVSGIVWGLGLFLLRPDDIAKQTMLFAMVLGMTAGASYYMIARTWALVATVVAVCLPSALAMLVSDVLDHRVFALCGFLLLGAAVRFILQSNRFTDRTRELSVAVERAQRDAEELARTDFLTGLPNRRAFYDAATAHFSRARHGGQPCSVILLDIDHFKAINDQLGHAAGDEAIRSCADSLRATVRETDLVSRIGGEEFAVFLPATHMAEASALAERIRAHLDAAPFAWLDRTIPMTASFGVAELSAGHQSLDALLGAADRAMYTAKQAGRNRLVRSDQMV